MANRMITYGYGMQDGELVIINAEAIIVKRVFKDYIDGKLLAEIADELTRESVEYFLGNCQWNKNRIARIIDNEKYSTLSRVSSSAISAKSLPSM